MAERFDTAQSATLPPAPEQPPPEATPPPADGATPEPESVDPVIVTPRGGGVADSPAKRRGLIILQIGDSHTSADFLTGELRRRLQARYGRGGAGYITAGKPHIGVRSSSLKVTASSGWTYKSLQRPDARPAEFWLAGYNATATAAGETMSFASERALIFDTIEIEAVAQPGGGEIEIRLDGKVEATQELTATRLEPLIIRLKPGRAATERVREITITTTKAGAVNVASVAIYNSRSGVTYNSIGYVGATAGLVNKFDQKLFASALQRIDPHIVVLAFGTNEAGNEGLDVAAYGRSYARVIDRIREVLPAAVIVVVSPPDFNELPAQCRNGKAAEATCRRPGAPAQAPAANGSAAASECAWRTPAKLQQVRDVQREIAQRYGLMYWNWASIMPRECGAHAWFTSSPPLMAKDHVHFTIEGYKKSADQFLNTLIPIIEKVRVGANVIPNY
jgi:lysophospholipase L1-like esterase